MSAHNRVNTLSINLLLFFIAMSFALVSGYLTKKCNEGLYCHPTNASLYQHCVPAIGLVTKSCPEQLLFNSKDQVCDWPHNSDCQRIINMNASPNSATDGPVPAADGPVPAADGPVPAADGPVPAADGPVPAADGPVPTTAGTTRNWLNSKSCDPKFCKLPNCRCPGDSIPGCLKLKTVPQIVLLTFDDGININNMDYYRKLNSQKLTNPNGCPIGLTYFVSGDYTDYKFVEELYQQGHEIASHSKTHRFPIVWWRNISYTDFEDEMVGMRTKLSRESSIPVEKIKGTRVPFLELSSDSQYSVLQNNNFVWDSSMIARRKGRPTWPFTLDYPVTGDNCLSPQCPKQSYPGFWEVPLVHWYDKSGTAYAMPDTNSRPTTKAEMLEFFNSNFEVHYKTNRAPFGIFIHATWFKKNNFNFEVLQEFLKILAEKKDVWIIPVSQAIDWVRNPKPMTALSEIPSWKCQTEVC